MIILIHDCFIAIFVSDVVLAHQEHSTWEMTFATLQKVSFLAAKNPTGRKSFLSLSARKKRKRYRRKKCPMIKKMPLWPVTQRGKTFPGKVA